MRYLSAVVDIEAQPSWYGPSCATSITFSGLWGALVARLLRRLNQRYLDAEGLSLKWHCEAWAWRQPGEARIG
jgi:hypothetical protein